MHGMTHLGNVGRKLLRTAAFALESGLQAGLIGAATCVFSGPAGMAAGFTTEFMMGVQKGATEMAMQEFLGYDRDQSGYFRLLVLL